MQVAREDDAQLSDRAEQILAGIEDGALQQDVHDAVEAAMIALRDLRRIHLPQDHFEARDDALRTSKHLELAPYVLGAITSIARLLAILGDKFPAPAASEEASSEDDFDLEFDLVDGPTGQGSGLTQQKESTHEWSEREQVGDAAFAFGGMLRSRVMRFGDRLEFALKQDNNWPLLAELDDATHKLIKSIQAVLFGVLGIFAHDVTRESILPQYRSAVSEAVALRTAITELAYHVAKFNDALSNADADTAVPLVVALADKLARFASRVEFRTMRAEDKKAVIDFRRDLYEQRHASDGLNMARLHHAVEGFSKFLEAMSAINNREVLLIHDRQRTEEGLAALERIEGLAQVEPKQAGDQLDDLVHGLETIVGRHPDIDDARRVYIYSPPAPAEIPSQIQQWRQMLTSVLTIL